MSFKGRNNTIFIGTKSAGYVTSTQGFKINDAVYLLISIGYGKDRKGYIYKQALRPDIYSGDEDSFNSIEADKKVLTAREWFKRKLN